MLTDEASRSRFLNTLDKTFFVEAGAGAGKTTALVGRIVELVKSGVPVDRIAAITFTEKAAAELQERVRWHLEKLAGDDAVEEDIRDRCLASIAVLDSAAIETLHAFAQRILQWHPLEAGLPPGFRVSDDFEARVDLNQWRRDVMDRLVEDDEVRVSLGWFLDLGCTMKQLYALLSKLVENWDRLQGEPLIPEADWRGSLEVMCGYRSQLEADQAGCLDPNDNLLASLSRLCEALDSLSEGVDDLGGCLKWASEDFSKGWSRGRKPSWPGGVDLVRERGSEAARAFALFQENVRLAMVRPLINRLQKEVLDYAEARRRAGIVQFQDLLVRARDLLRNSSRVRKHLYERLHTILIDEYQDTDPLQVEIVALIAGNPPHHSAGWAETEVPSGRLAFVGDPKQSIYRFRRADIGVYRRTEATIGGEKLTLDSNFRCAMPIIDFVNETFEEMIGGDASGCGYVPLRFAKGVPAETGSVRFFSQEVTGSAEQVKRLEADTVARAIITALGQSICEARPGADPPEYEFRKARLSDVAILIPTRTVLPALQLALERYAIPYRVESRSLLFSMREVNELVNLLKAIDDPSNEVAVVGALRSCAFALTEQDLYDHVQEGGKWNYCQEGRRGSEKVSRALDLLLGFHQVRLDLSPAMLLEKVIATCQMMEVGLSASRPRDRWQRYRLLINQARMAGAAAGSTLRQFIEWCKMSEEEKAWVRETVAPESDDDAVSILTLHAAKGLEFPIVAVCGLDSLSTRVDNCFWDGNGAFVMRYCEEHKPKCCTAGAEEAYNAEKEQLRAELTRLMYVGCTRAKDHLIVCAYYKHIKKEDSEARGARRLAEHVHDKWRAQLISDESGPQTCCPGDSQEPAFVPETSESRSAWLNARSEALHKMSVLKTRAATTIAHDLGKGPDDPALIEYHQGFEDALPSRRGRAGTSIGRAVHATLQSIDLADPSEVSVRTSAEAHAAAEGLTQPEQVEMVVRHALSAITAAPVLEAVRSKRWWREVFVAAEVEGVLLEGYIDLMWECDDGSIRLLDYKTDGINTNDDSAEFMVQRRYRLQAATYALALEKSLGLRPASAQFVFSATHPATVVLVEDLEAAMSEVAASLAGV